MEELKEYLVKEKERDVDRKINYFQPFLLLKKNSPRSIY